MNRNDRLTPRLTEADTRAVDALLDQSVSGLSGGPMRPLSSRDLRDINRTLELLSMMPTVDPPAGLAARVLQAIDEDARLSYRPNTAVPSQLHA